MPERLAHDGELGRQLLAALQLVQASAEADRAQANADAKAEGMDRVFDVQKRSIVGPALMDGTVQRVIRDLPGVLDRLEPRE